MGIQSAANAVIADDRRSYRNDIRLPAVLRAGPVEHDIVILNVSAHGLMAEVGHNLMPGRPVTIEATGFGPVRSRIAWVRDGHAGIAFVQPLSIEQLLAIV